MNVLSLFSGIGGLELGLERAGMTVVGQVELDPFCRSVLARHWPEVPKYDDVRTAPNWWGTRPRPVVDLIAGGFPCQPFSHTGRRAGITDERWGWPWMESTIHYLRPRYVVVENVAALLNDTVAFGIMLSDLAALGFDAEWSVLSACSVGAPHMRARLFLVAYPEGSHGQEGLAARPGGALLGIDGGPHSWGDGVDGFHEAERRSRRVVNGVPDELEPARIKGLGNAVVPQVAEHIGRLIMAADHALAGAR